MDKIAERINRFLERLFMAILLWLYGRPDKPWDDDD